MQNRMSSVVRSRVVPIGNSGGIRIPKTMLGQAGLCNEVDLEVRDGALIVRSAARPRSGWEAQFQRMAERGDDKPLDPEPVANDWDEDWAW